MKASYPASHPDNQQQETIAYAELLKIAHDEGLKSIVTQLLATPTEDNGHRAIVKAVVEVERGRFEGLGDADPSNVESFLAPHLIRVAEDRAKARALRDAVNCGIVSQEELGGALPEATVRDSGPGASDPPPPSRPRYSNDSASRGTLPRAPRRSNGADNGPMSEAQRRYLFRLAAGRGFPGTRGEEFLKEQLGVTRLVDATRADASALIDELVHSAPARGAGNGAAAHQH